MTNNTPPPKKDPIQIMEETDRSERKRLDELMSLTRPDIIAGRRLPWDRFWRAISSGIDGILWRWFGGEVDVARAREDFTQNKTKSSKDKNTSHDPPAN